MKRMATKKLIRTFIDTEVVRKRGHYVLAIVLYATFVSRTGADTSAARFFREMIQRGYRIRRSLGGDVFENVSLKGV